MRYPIGVTGAFLSACAAAPGEPAANCTEGDPDRERWGTDCSCCHDEFGVAGSVEDDPSVARIVVVDAKGRRAEMMPNPYGNFFRHLRLDPPLQAQVYGPDGRMLRMKTAAPHGSCNGCHAPGLEAARIHGP
ncbi:MAG: hypothetical protein AABZ30_07855 [Myxococcota bacterium]